MIKPILKLDERKQIPILWSFSSQEVMTVRDFINACSEKGFPFSARWLSTAGSYFRTLLVKEDGMLEETKLKINGKRTWKLTDVGKIKIKEDLSKIIQKKN